MILYGLLGIVLSQAGLHVVDVLFWCVVLLFWAVQSNQYTKGVDDGVKTCEKALTNAINALNELSKKFEGFSKEHNEQLTKNSRNS